MSSDVEKRPDSIGRMQPVKAPAKGATELVHGAKSEYTIAPLVKSTKVRLLRAMGCRMNELSWAGREALNLYARTLAKIAAIDNWLKDNPMLDEAGRPAPCLALYSTLQNTATRQLAALVTVIEAMARQDNRFDAAVSALAAEAGRR